MMPFRSSLCAFALAAAIPVAAQTYLLQEDFEGSVFPPVGWTVYTTPGNFADGWTRGPQPGLFANVCVPQGTATMVSQWATYYPNDTWAFTPGLAMVAGNSYTISFRQCVQSPSANKTESLRVTAGLEATTAAQTQVLLDLPTLTNTSPTEHNIVYTPSQSGVYHLGFQCYSAANQRYLSIDDIRVSTNTPAAKFPSPYCPNTYAQGVAPITRVEFAGIAHPSPALTSAPGHENFLSTTGSVVAGATYPIVVKGNTNGAFTHHVSVYVDWDQDLDLSGTNEAYPVGTLYNSTGNDGVQAMASITVPANALPGSTRMRVIKWKGGYAEGPCATGGAGQSEDYTLLVSAVTSVSVATQGNVPAYITTNGGTLQLVSTVHPATMDQSVTWSIGTGSGAASINTSGLVTAQGNGNVWAVARSVVAPHKMDSLQITIINQVVPATGITISTQGNVPPTIHAGAPTLGLLATIVPADASQAAVWSVAPVTGNASISTSGTLTPLQNGTVWAKARAAAQPTVRDSILVSINILGLSIAEQPALFSIHPNPTTDRVHLSTTGQHAMLQWTLLDLSGRTVMGPGQLVLQAGSGNLDLRTLGTGTYVLQLSADGIRTAYRIVKE